MRLATLLLVGIFGVVSCQWVQHNITSHVINTTYIQGPVFVGRPPVQYIVSVRNLTQYPSQPNGYINAPNTFYPSRTVLLFSQTYFKAAKFLQVREIIVKYPVQTWGMPSSRLITAVTFRDLQGRGNAQIVQGGIGRRNVTIRLQSQRGSALHYEVFIYGV